MEEKRAELQKETTEKDGPGNPNLVYLSKFVEGWEPSGVPVRTYHVQYDKIGTIC